MSYNRYSELSEAQKILADRYINSLAAVGHDVAQDVPRLRVVEYAYYPESQPQTFGETFDHVVGHLIDEVIAAGAGSCTDITIFNRGVILGPLITATRHRVGGADIGDDGEYAVGLLAIQIADAYLARI